MELPNSTEAEEHLISCCFIDGGETVALAVDAGVAADDFFLSANQIIFGKILHLFHRNIPITVAALAEELKQSGQLDQAGGYMQLMQVSALIPTTAQTDFFIKRVRDLATLRAFIRTTQRLAEQAYNPQTEIASFLDTAESEIFSVTQEKTPNTIKPASGPTKEAMGVIEKMMMQRGALTGVGSGFLDLDKLIWGFQRQDVIVLAARPSMGKTALALNFAEAAALPIRGQPAPTLIFSLEMSAAQLALRLLCSRARVNMQLLRDGLVHKNPELTQKLVAAAGEISSAPLFIDDSSALSILQLRAKARRMQMRQPLGMIVVDYLQLLSPTDGRVPREQQVAEASRGLKAMAKELNVPVIVLSQLNRASEKENRVPRLADLRESGSIEQDADVVLMLARPMESEEKFQVAGDSANLIVAKQRNGPVGELRLTFLREITRFENWARDS